jgi:hypothetical protein
VSQNNPTPVLSLFETPKQRGDFSFEISPLAIRFFEDLVRHTDHNYSSLQNCSEPSGGARASRTLPSFHSLQELSCSIRGSQLPECCVSLASGSLASPLSASLAGIVSDALPSSVAGSLPNFVPESHPEFLPRHPCGFRFWFPWSSFPGALASPASGSPTALVHSLLLEDFSSVELKDTRDLPENHRLSQLNFCGNIASFVEIRPISSCFKG